MLISTHLDFSCRDKGMCSFYKVEEMMQLHKRIETTIDSALYFRQMCIKYLKNKVKLKKT